MLNAVIASVATSWSRAGKLAESRPGLIGGRDVVSWRGSFRSPVSPKDLAQLLSRRSLTPRALATFFFFYSPVCTHCQLGAFFCRHRDQCLRT